MAMPVNSKNEGAIKWAAVCALVLLAAATLIVTTALFVDPAFPTAG